MKYRIFQRQPLGTAPYEKLVMDYVPECAIRSYLNSYAGNLETLTIYGSDDPDRVDGLSAQEWLADNSEPPVPAVTATPEAPEGVQGLPADISWRAGWEAGYAAGQKSARSVFGR